MSLKILSLSLGEIPTNGYLVVSGNEAAVIDPADKGRAFYYLAEENGCKIKYVLLTHGHYDHIGGVDELVGMTGAKVYIHELDKELLTDPVKNASPEGRGVVCKSDVLTFVSGDVFGIGDEKITAVHTPGHTKGSSCFFTSGPVFTGDTLFADGYGRTDLYGGDHEAIYNSLMSLLRMVKGRKIFPGHGKERDF